MVDEREPGSTEPETPPLPAPGTPEPVPMGPRPGQIYTLMARVMADVPAVGKTRQAPKEAGGYPYRGIDDMYLAVQAALIKYGVVCSPRLVDKVIETIQTKSGGRATHILLTIDHWFYAPDGSAMITTTLGESIDTGDKAANKAMSAAYKYALIETFCVPTMDPKADTEAEHHEVAGPAPSQRAAQTRPAAATATQARPAAPPPAAAQQAAAKLNLTELLTLVHKHRIPLATQAAWCSHFATAMKRTIGGLEDLTQPEVDAIAAKIKKKNEPSDAGAK
jgi:hypothetical protein